jgi:hypothetical protein
MEVIMNTFKKLTIVTMFAVSALGTTVQAAQSAQPAPQLVVQVQEVKQNSACARFTGKVAEVLAENFVVQPLTQMYNHKLKLLTAITAAGLAIYAQAPDDAPFSERNREHYEAAFGALLTAAQATGEVVLAGGCKLVRYATSPEVCRYIASLITK